MVRLLTFKGKIMNNVGERIFKLRKERKLSREALGAKVGVSKTAVLTSSPHFRERRKSKLNLPIYN